MARIRFVLFMLFLSSLGVKGQQAEKYLSHPLPAGWQEQGCHVSTGFAGG